jgi:hypothetical protein
MREITGLSGSWGRAYEGLPGCSGEHMRKLNQERLDSLDKGGHLRDSTKRDCTPWVQGGIQGSSTMGD